MNKDSFCIYPIYIDSRRSLSNGRKYALKNCISNPLFNEISEALDEIHVEYKRENEKRHPKEPFVYGRVHIHKKYGKQYILDGILNYIRNKRNKSDIKSVTLEEKSIKKSSSNNPLKLVPKKKKNSKKK